MQLRFTILLGFFQQADAKERRRNAVRKTDINRYAKAEKNTAGNTFCGDYVRRRRCFEKNIPHTFFCLHDNGDYCVDFCRIFYL